MNLLYQDVLAIAVEAASAIMAIAKQKTYSINEKLDNSPVTEADLAAHTIIYEGLSRLTPSIPILSEEGVLVPLATRKHWHRFWLVDPLDGTREFIKGSAEFTVNIALIENHTPILGVIVAPALQQHYWASVGTGAYCMAGSHGEITPIHTAKGLLTSPTIAISRNFKVQNLAKSDQEAWLALKNRLGAECEVIYCGSSLKICWIANGLANIYPRLGTTMEWDTAAGQCILEAAGGVMVDTNGQPLRYNLKETLTNPTFYAVQDSHLASRCCG